MKVFFYADKESIDLLRSGASKALLLGSDFGYGNFGDVLQHVGAAARTREVSGLPLVSVVALEAIARFVTPEAMKKAYKLEGLMFMSEAPLSAEDCQRLGLAQVRVLSNVAIVHLYGGGFLNEMWGDFSLQIVEFLLARLPGATYIVSGQQVTAGYARRTAEHIEAFRPLAFGVRDRDSLRSIEELGVAAAMSFDDAVEPLLSMSRRFELKRGEGCFIHLNSSGYTGNEAGLTEMSRHLRLLAGRIGKASRPVLFQAFQDAREEVVDSVETVKRLERAFPFASVETALLVEAILSPETHAAPRILRGDVGYSCSYHITLWLQLNGVPCWLRGNNAYYDQKRRSLGVEGDFETFLADTPIVDHGEKLATRALWLKNLDEIVASVGPVINRVEWEPVVAETPFRKFEFKGEPRLEARLNETWSALCGLKDEREQLIEACSRLEESIVALEEARVAADLQRERDGEERAQLQQELAHTESRLLACNEQVTQIGAEARRYQRQVEAAQEELQAMESRLLACNEQLSWVGAEARRYREVAESVSWNVAETAAREREANEQLRQVLSSRSWRLTRPLRAINRFRTTGRFDAAGEVGMFEMTRKLGARMPLPARWKSQIGFWLQGWRRR